jgi:anti-anti-sigma factor
MMQTTKINEKTIVIRPGRVLDSNNAEEMSQAIDTAVSGGFRFIVLDMGELEVISSAGVGSVIGSVDVLRAYGGDIVLCNVRDMVRHIFEVLDLCDYLTMETNGEAALSYCTSRV